MAKIVNMNWMKTISVLFITAMNLTASVDTYAKTAEIVTTHRDESGWRLKKGGEDYFVKGVVWGYTPRGENYTYSLWNKPEEHIKAVLDHEFSLMKKS